MRAHQSRTASEILYVERDAHDPVGKHCQLLWSGLFAAGMRTCVASILLLGSMLAQTKGAVAQGTAPQREAPAKACDLAAASPYDKQRPADVPGVAFNDLDANVAIPACEAAVRAAPQDPRMLGLLGRAFRRARMFAQALPYLHQAARLGDASAANEMSIMRGNGEGGPVDLKAQANYLNQAAQAGFSIAQASLAMLYLNGNAAVPKDTTLARRWMSLAANNNNPYGMYGLGSMLFKGIGGNQDYVEARKWFEKAANAGSPEATNSLGVMFATGMGGPQDLAEARRLFQKAIAMGEREFAAIGLQRLDRDHPELAQGAPPSQGAPDVKTSEPAPNVQPREATQSEAVKACDVAAALPEDKQRPADVPGVPGYAFGAAVAIPACEAAVRAAPQDPRMLYQLGRAYFGARRPADALPRFRQAAQMGNAFAANDLARMYGNGIGVPVDLKAQAYYLNQAAEAGVSDAQRDLALLYLAGNAAVPKDERLARQWFALAARSNFPPAMVGFGMMLEEGLGGNKDPVEARSWYEKAARAGNLEGMNLFGLDLQLGRGGPQDSFEARKWLERAASRNHPVATTRLAALFQYGAGGPQNFDEARRLFKRAIALGETQYAPKDLAELDRTHPATTQSTAPSETTQNVQPSQAAPSEALKACDLAAALPEDKQRPADVPGVFSNAFNPSVAIPACEAAVRAAPQDPRMLYQLARGYFAAKRFAEALPLYQQAAQMGNAFAANALASMYGNGLGVPVDLKAQAYYLDQAAQAGLGTAQSILGALYLFGNTAVTKDSRLARRWISLAANNNVPVAMYNLGLMLERGVGGNQDAAEARKWYEKASNANNAEATDRLGLMFLYGRGGPTDFDEARRLFKKAIALGETKYAPQSLALLDKTHPAAPQGAPPSVDPPNVQTSEPAPNVQTSQAAPSEAQRACDLAAALPEDKQRPADVPGVFSNAFNPGVAIPACEDAVRATPQDPRMLYQLARGYFAAKRFEEALPLNQQAAQMGNAFAANALALMYGKGLGVPVDLKAQAFYLNQAAQAGLAMAQSNLGLLLIRGNAAVPKNEGVAKQWLALAAKNDNPAAMFSLGLMIDKGMGGNQDATEARSWYEKAALAGNLDGMDSFGMVLQSGRGGPQDSVEARKWFEKAASRNHPGATTRLGLMFRDGLGGPKDLEEARRLFKKAIALGETQFAPRSLAKLDRTGGAAPPVSGGQQQAPPPQPPGLSSGTSCQRFPSLC